MCGITGAWCFSNSGSDHIKDIVSKMTDTLKHRGPNDQGIWHEENIALGHRRLSIVDLSSMGHQPMVSENGRYILVFNGEIYNYKEISQALHHENIICNSKNDTSVLLNACIYWGIEKTLKKINGMFAFGFYDKFEKKLVLARDRFGEKPLYYAYLPHQYFCFGSELKALKCCPFIDKSIDPNALNLYLSFNYIPCPYSIYKNVKKLFPGHYLIVSEDNLQENIYYNLTTAIQNRSLINVSEEACVDLLEKKLINSVKNRMEADVPVGAFLSGGIDSSLMVSLMQSVSNVPIKTFTVGFENSPWDESAYAQKIAKHLHTDHTTLYLSQDEILENVQSITSIYDEPFGDASALSTYAICKKIKQYVTVAVGGDGGDELFGGYYRHQWVPKLNHLGQYVPNTLLSLAEKFLPKNRWPVFAGKVKKGLHALQGKSFLQTYLNSLQYWSKKLDLNATEFRLHPLLKNTAEQVMFLDMKTFLHDDVLCKVDRASMAVALETRAPFLDYDLVDFAWTIPLHLKVHKHCKKYLLKKLLERYLPQALWNRPKMGFGMPLADVFRTTLKSTFDQYLNTNTLLWEYLPKNIVSNLWQQHLSKKINHELLLWNFFVLQQFLILF